MISTDSGDTAAAYVRSRKLLNGRGRIVAPRLLHVHAVELGDAGLERAEQHLRRLDEDLAALVHVDAEAFELDATEAAAEPEHDATVRDVVEHRHLLGNAQRVVPWQHHHHRASWRRSVRPAK